MWEVSTEKKQHCRLRGQHWPLADVRWSRLCLSLEQWPYPLPPCHTRQQPSSPEFFGHLSFSQAPCQLLEILGRTHSPRRETNKQMLTIVC